MPRTGLDIRGRAAESLPKKAPATSSIFFPRGSSAGNFSFELLEDRVMHKIPTKRSRNTRVTPKSGVKKKEELTRRRKDPSRPHQVQQRRRR